MIVSSDGYGESAQTRRLAIAFDARPCGKYKTSRVVGSAVAQW